MMGAPAEMGHTMPLPRRGLTSEKEIAVFVAVMEECMRGRPTQAEGLYHVTGHALKRGIVNRLGACGFPAHDLKAYARHGNQNLAFAAYVAVNVYSSKFSMYSCSM